MHDTLPHLVDSDFPPLRRRCPTVLQMNLGYLCNLACVHCHVGAGPKRRELMDWDTMALALGVARRYHVRTLDLTGGSPEMNPDFRTLVIAARRQGMHIMDRCNPTILVTDGYEWVAEFLAAHAVEVVASLPCYGPENVDRQRGPGVFERSIAGLRQLNALGYGEPDSGLTLNLVYNPVGPSLPPPQSDLEGQYQLRLERDYGVRFNHLFTLANMPIQRFGSWLISRGEFQAYMGLLRAAHRPENLEQVMCRDLISVDYLGYLYDCDFNQMLGIPLGGCRTHLRDLLDGDLTGKRIAVADHCYGCTAGQGSSCGGALT
ncbi:MAG: arsenosugar biosynthesis radical SAM protein ArsS [Pseudomonadota bacterium]|nr:arsenosugar biosynthesis radical SAM protein ArsS [Pseudomonadota bacterium]